MTELEPRYYATNEGNVYKRNAYKPAGADGKLFASTPIHQDCAADAEKIAAALNSQDDLAALLHDNVGLFSYVFELKKECAALMRERDMAVSALDTALDRIDTLNRAALEGMGYCDMVNAYEAVNRIHAALKAVAQTGYVKKG